MQGLKRIIKRIGAAMAASAVMALCAVTAFAADGTDADTGRTSHVMADIAVTRVVCADHGGALIDGEYRKAGSTETYSIFFCGDVSGLHVSPVGERVNAGFVGDTFMVELVPDEGYVLDSAKVCTVEDGKAVFLGASETGRVSYTVSGNTVSGTVEYPGDVYVLASFKAEGPVDKEAVRTGDTGHAGLWAAAVCVSFAVIVACMTVLIKRIGENM